MSKAVETSDIMANLEHAVELLSKGKDSYFNLPSLISTLAHYRNLQMENEELKSALSKTPCTGNGTNHVLSCFKCSILEKFKDSLNE